MLLGSCGYRQMKTAPGRVLFSRVNDLSFLFGISRVKIEIQRSIIAILSVLPISL